MPASTTSHPFAVVTGASSGIGLELARQFIAHDFDVVVTAEVSIDGQPPEIVELPTNHAGRRYAPFWRYNLPAGRHTVRISVRPLPADTTLFLERVIIYGPEPRRPPV
jgi:NAD(P)-dependent dehydrogenase (short-subunit alcohol dehydrogenase family)